MLNLFEKLKHLRFLWSFLFLLVIIPLFTFSILPTSIRERILQQLSLLIVSPMEYQVCTNPAGDKGYLLNHGMTVVFKDHLNKALVCAKIDTNDTDQGNIKISVIDPANFSSKPLSLSKASARNVFETFASRLKTAPFVCSTVSAADSQVSLYLRSCP